MISLLDSCPKFRPLTRPLPVASTKPWVDRPFVPQGPDFTHALAIILDDECVRRWAMVLHEELHPGELATLSPEEAEKAIHIDMIGPPDYVPQQVYTEFPNFPRLKRNLLMVDGCDIPGQDPDSLLWLLVLRDNSTVAAGNVPIDPEELKAVKEFLGVMKQGAKWYDVSRRIS